MKFLTTLLRNYRSIPKAFKTGHRLSQMRGENAIKGLAYGVKKTHKTVGTLPLVTTGIGIACVPLPGAGAVGFTIGSIIKEGVKVGTKLMKIG